MTLKHNPSGQQQTQMGSAMQGAREQQSTGSSYDGGAEEQFSLGSLGGMFELPAAADAQSEVLTKARSVLEADIKQLSDPNFDITIEGLDRENPNLNIGVSLLVLTVRNKRSPASGIGYHTLLLAASAPEPGSKQILLQGGKSVDLREVPGDLFDDVMVSEIRRELDRRYQGIPLYAADGRVIPVSFNWDDQGLVKRLRVQIVKAAAMALIVQGTKFTDLNLRRIKRDPTLSVHTSFKNPQIIDSVGLPKRADIRVKFRAGSQQQGQASNGSSNLDKQKDISEVAGFVDFIHNRQQLTNPFQSTQFQHFPQDSQAALLASQQFFARFVITYLRSSSAPTHSQTLLSLLTVYTLRKPAAYFPQFLPNYRMGRDNDIDLADVGVIGLETMPDANGIGQRVDTKKESFGAQALGQLLGAFVRPGLIVSMDIEECGEDTWANGDFAAAANTKNTDVREAAYKRLYEAADWLTDGEFSKLFGYGDVICFNENNRIQNGVYTGPASELRDTRDLDLLAAYNLMGERDLKVPRDWNDTFLMSDFPIEQRLDHRLQLQSQLMPDMKLTGYSSRVTFTDKFLQSLTKAAELTGHLVIREVNTFNDSQGYEVPQYAWTNQALGSYQPNTVFTQTGFGGPSGNAQRSTGRW